MKMKNGSKHLIACVLSFALYSVNSVLFAQDYEFTGYDRIAADTVELGAYYAILFDHYDHGHKSYLNNEIGIFKGQDELITIDEGGASFADLRGFDSTRCKNPYFCDINADGKREFLISYYTGGANCCFGAYLYSVGDTLELQFHIEPNLRDYSLIDLDKDRIPEFVYFDNLFAHWQDCYRCYLPLLIWRWDGEKYRLANYRYSDYILKDYDLAHLPCGEDWGTVITLYYAGKSEIADSLFNACWPLDELARTSELEAFKKYFGYNKFLKELQESFW